MSKRTLSEDKMSAITETALVATQQVALKKETLKQAKAAFKAAEKGLKQARTDFENAGKLALTAQKQLKKSTKKFKNPKTVAKGKAAKSQDESPAPATHESTVQQHSIPGSDSIPAS